MMGNFLIQEMGNKYERSINEKLMIKKISTIIVRMNPNGKEDAPAEGGIF
jgi:hypothetical protein